MNTLLLTYAIEVEKTGSISKAAQNLYMNQPSMSKAIRGLESKIGFLIFERTSKGMRPTTKGLEFLVRAKDILARIAALEAMQHPQQAVSVMIAAGECDLLWQTAKQLTEQWKAENLFHLKFLPASSRSAIILVSKGECSMGVIQYASSENDLARRLLDENSLDSILIDEGSLTLLTSTDLSNQVAEEPSLTIRSSAFDLSNWASKELLLYKREERLSLVSTLSSSCLWETDITNEELTQYHLSCVPSQKINYRTQLIFSRETPLSQPEQQLSEMLIKK